MGYDMAKYLSTYNFDLFLVAKDKKDRISAAGEMSYFSLLHLLIWY